MNELYFFSCVTKNVRQNKRTANSIHCQYTTADAYQVFKITDKAKKIVGDTIQSLAFFF